MARDHFGLSNSHSAAAFQQAEDLTFESAIQSVLSTSILYANASPPPPLFPRFVAIPLDTQDAAAPGADSTTAKATVGSRTEVPTKAPTKMPSKGGRGL